MRSIVLRNRPKNLPRPLRPPSRLAQPGEEALNVHLLRQCVNVVATREEVLAVSIK